MNPTPSDDDRETPAEHPPAEHPPASASATPHDSVLERDQQRLVEFFAPYSSCLVAFSGGVDSAVVAQAAYLALGDQARAVMASSPSVASGEVESARQTAIQIGIPFETIETDEIHDPNYRINDARRCYHCKTELYTQLTRLRHHHPKAILCSGANADDLDDYRPGLQAAEELGVLHPLAELGLGKQTVRDLAKSWGLDVWDKPAMPCLSSRIAYGLEVTPERLRRIDAAESHLKTLGLSHVRVRYHGDDLARIEVPVEDIDRVITLENREAILAHLKTLGFRFVTIDLTGFQSGSLNQLLQITPRHELQR